MAFPSCGRVARLAGFLLAASPAFAGALAAQPFSFSLLPHDLPARYAGAVDFADVDNDGDLDAFVAGRPRDPEAAPTAGVYRNDSPRARHAAPVFVPLAALDGVAYAAVAWGDYDRDGDLDLFVAGSATARPPYAPVARLYRNDGAGGFTQTAAGIEGLHSGAAAWGDYDGDGDLDLVVSGTAAADLPYTPATALYRNDTAPGGAAAFVRVDAGLPNLTFGDLAWGDYDADGDLDLALSGYGGARGPMTAVHRNDGGTFTDIGAALPGLAFSAVDWGDYDGDGALDLVVSGGRTSAFLFDGEAHVYRGGGGAFTRVDLGDGGVLAGEAGWGDYDGDGDLDLLVIGAARPLDRYAARVYENMGDASFRERVLLIGGVFADAAWGDYDGDGDLDLLAAGLAQPTLPPINATVQTRIPFTNLYRNDRAPLDVIPTAPAGLRADVSGGDVSLAWAPPAVPGPGAPRMTYALRIGTRPGGADVVAPAADPASGLRRTTHPGEAAAPSWTLRGLAPGTYHWAVQTVSPAFVGSGWAEGGAFHVGSVVDDEADVRPSAFSVAAAYPNPFSGTARIAYTLPAPSDVTLRVYDALGAVVRTVRRADPSGAHAVEWDGADDAGRPAPSGVYLYELRTAHGARSGRVVRIR